MNVADPAKPVVAGSYQTEGWAYGVFADSSFVYVTDNAGYLLILDARDAGQPALVSRCPVGGAPSRVFAADGYVYVAAGFDGLRVIDAHDPGQPREVAAWNPGGYLADVWVAGSRAYVPQPDGSRGLWVLDISSPTAPRPAGFGRAIGSPQNVVVSGRFAYLGTGNCGLEIMDIASPQPTVIGYYRTFRSGTGTCVDGNRIYLADMHDGVYVFESPVAPGVSEPGAPEPVSRYRVAPNPFARKTEITVSSPGMNRAGGPVTLLIFDVAGRAVRRLASSTNTRDRYVFSWDGRDDAGADLPAGVYLCALAPGAAVGHGRLLRLK